MPRSSASPPLDNSIRVITPENIAFRYRVAGPFQRLPAFILDTMIRIVVFVLLVFLVGMLGVFVNLSGMLGLAIGFLAFFALEWLYGGVLEAVWNGQTIGKRMMGIRVLGTDGQPITALQAMLRNILRFADMMPLIPLTALADSPDVPPYPVPTMALGLVAVVVTRHFQRLGDIVCGTMVVIDSRTALREPPQMADPQAVKLAEQIPANFVVPAKLAKTLSSYVERRQRFPPARRHELCRHLAQPLIAEFRLPPDTSFDLLVCALYRHAFQQHQQQDHVLPQSYLLPQSVPPAGTTSSGAGKGVVPDQLTDSQATATKQT